MSEKFTTPEGRLVGGHPLTRRTIVKKGVTQMMPDGTTPQTEAYIGFAIPKTPGVDWKQTPWGMIMVAQAAAGWPGGQSLQPGFAWKVTDGDSAVPNTKQIAPNTREGYPGHWVLQASTRLVVNAYHVGKYDPIDQIHIPGEINPGDYGRLQIELKPNGSTDSPGMYLNPSLWEQRRTGELIVLNSGADANAAFGDGGATTATTTAPATTVAPATDFLNGGGEAAPPPANSEAAPPPAAVKRMYGGKAYTETALTAGGHKPDQIASYPLA